MDENHASDLSRLWAFVRGDENPLSFEVWLLSRANLEDLLGSELHWDLVSSDFRNKDVVWSLRLKLRERLEDSAECECPSLRDLAVVPMGGDGLDERVFASVERIQDHGGTEWWLYLARCRRCEQDWLVAQDERIYDDYLLKRLNKSQASAIENAGDWPSDFSSYEKVLRLERELSTPPWWFDLKDSPVAITITELRAANPDLSLEEAAYITGIDSASLKVLGFTA